MTLSLPNCTIPPARDPVRRDSSSKVHLSSDSSRFAHRCWLADDAFHGHWPPVAVRAAWKGGLPSEVENGCSESPPHPAEHRVNDSNPLLSGASHRRRRRAGRRAQGRRGSRASPEAESRPGRDRAESAATGLQDPRLRPLSLRAREKGKDGQAAPTPDRNRGGQAPPEHR